MKERVVHDRFPGFRTCETSIIFNKLFSNGTTLVRWCNDGAMHALFVKIKQN